MKSKNWLKSIPVIFILLAFATAILYLVFVAQANQNGALAASGTVEAVEIQIAPEIGGKVAGVLVEQGEKVKSGQPLLMIDDQLYQAQRKRTTAALALAQANLEAATAAQSTAKANLDTAQAQYEVVINKARSQTPPERTAFWTREQNAEFTLPVWYFDKQEEISAARAEVSSAQKELEQEQAQYAQLTAGISSAIFDSVETRLAETQAAFLVAEAVRNRANEQNDENIKQYAQDLYDSALAELEFAQSQYKLLLTDKSAADVHEARARLSVARERNNTALDQLNQLLTGEDSLPVQAAFSAVGQAQAALVQAAASVTQAQRAVDQAQAEIELVDVQLSKLTLKAPIDGVVMTRSVEAGEVVQPGAELMTIGQLDQLTIKVYIAEDRYGEIHLDQHVRVTVDSFPTETFDAVVVNIADQAEFTPRNVQTEEGRRTTVFAIKLAVTDPQGKLKPGMPADVTFEQ